MWNWFYSRELYAPICFNVVSIVDTTNRKVMSNKNKHFVDYSPLKNKTSVVFCKYTKLKAKNAASIYPTPKQPKNIVRMYELMSG